MEEEEPWLLFYPKAAFVRDQIRRKTQVTQLPARVWDWKARNQMYSSSSLEPTIEATIKTKAIENPSSLVENPRRRKCVDWCKWGNLRRKDSEEERICCQEVDELVTRRR